jgi:Phosphoenolpyruvate synthase/pyruvate phosphate dikinase
MRAAKQRDRFDGFSIGSNDLTQFTLLVAELFDERHTLRPQDRHLRPGTQRLPRIRPLPWGEEGIDSISLNLDAVIATRLEVARIEASLV